MSFGELFIETYTPHLAEEEWEHIQKFGFLSPIDELCWNLFSSKRGKGLRKIQKQIALIIQQCLAYLDSPDNEREVVMSAVANFRKKLNNKRLDAAFPKLGALPLKNQCRSMYVAYQCYHDNRTTYEKIAYAVHRAVRRLEKECPNDQLLDHVLTALRSAANFYPVGKEPIWRLELLPMVTAIKTARESNKSRITKLSTEKAYDSLLTKLFRTQIAPLERKFGKDWKKHVAEILPSEIVSGELFTHEDDENQLEETGQATSVKLTLPSIEECERALDRGLDPSELWMAKPNAKERLTNSLISDEDDPIAKKANLSSALMDEISQWGRRAYPLNYYSILFADLVYEQELPILARDATFLFFWMIGVGIQPYRQLLNVRLGSRKDFAELYTQQADFEPPRFFDPHNSSWTFLNPVKHLAKVPPGRDFPQIFESTTDVVSIRVPLYRSPIASEYFGFRETIKKIQPGDDLFMEEGIPSGWQKYSLETASDYLNSLRKKYGLSLSFAGFFPSGFWHLVTFYSLDPVDVLYVSGCLPKMLRVQGAYTSVNGSELTKKFDNALSRFFNDIVLNILNFKRWKKVELEKIWREKRCPVMVQG